MTSKNTGKEYEKYIGELYEALTVQDDRTRVELDVKIESAAGTKRQIDVLVTTAVAGMEVRTVIEAKDWKGTVPVDVIDGLVTKMRSINAHKGVVVSKNGFQSGTITEAKFYDIDLCTTKKISEVFNSIKQIPAVVHYIPLNQVNVSVSLPDTFNRSTILDLSQILVDGRPAFEIFREELFLGQLNPKIRRPLTEGELKMQSDLKVSSPVVDNNQYQVPMNVWEPKEGSKLKYNDPVSGYMVSAEKMSIKYFLIYEYYFGYLGDLDNTTVLENISTSRSDAFINIDELADFQNKFTKFTNIEDIAVSEAANFHCLGDISLQRLSEEFQYAVSKRQ